MRNTPGALRVSSILNAAAGLGKQALNAIPKTMSNALTKLRSVE
jgi:hypothetical protein